MSCGAEVQNLVCRYCGGSSRPLRTVEDEHEGLMELHEIARGVSEEETRARLFKGAHIPMNVPVLVEAGLQCLPLIEDGKVVDRPVVQRLEAVIARLKIGAPPDETVRRALGEFEARVARYEAADRRLGRWIIGTFLVVVAAMAAGAWALWR